MDSKVRAFKNSFYLSFSSFVCRGLLCFIIYYLAVKMGSEKLGVYAFAQSIFVFGIFFSNLGMRLYGVREVIKRPEGSSEFISELFLLGLFMKLLIFLTLSGFILLLDFSLEKKLVCLIFLAAIFPDVIVAPTNVLFNAREKLGYPAFVDVVTRSLYAACAILIIYFWQSLVGVALSNLLCGIFGSLFLFYIARRRFTFLRISFNARRLFSRFKELLPFALINVFGIIYVGVDILMLGIIRGDKAVGWYKVGILIPQEGIFLLRFVSLSIFPLMTRLYLRDKREMTGFVRKLYKFYLAHLLPFALIITLFAKDILLLFFPDEYFRSSYALVILIWFLPIQYICAPFLLGLQIADRQVIITKIAGILAILNIILNALFIFLIGGDFVGAGPALGTLISTFVALVLIVRVYRREIDKINFLSDIRKPLLSLTATVLFYLLAQAFASPLFSVVLSVFVYYMGLFALGESPFRGVLDFLKDLMEKEPAS